MVKKVMAGFFVGFLCFSLVGCVAVLAGAAGGAGTAVWLGGKLSQEVQVSYDKSISATRRGLQALKLEIAKETRAEEVTQFRSKYTDGREIWIDVRPITSASSKIDVRVGAAGDKDAADQVMKSILRYL